MSADALRQVFAEFGFKVDDAPLEKMLSDTERQIALEEKLSKAERKVLAETRRADAEKAKAAEDERKRKEKEAEDTAKSVAKAAEEEVKALLAAIPGGRLLGQVAGSTRVRLLALGAGLMAVVAGAHQFASTFAADVTALREASDAARVTEQQFQQLTFAGVAAGVSAETTAGAVNTLAEGLRATEARTGGPTNALWRLGVRARNVDGTMRDTNDVLLDLADRFERVRSPVHRARLAQELFGASGRRMLQVLAGGSAALRRQREDFAALGGGVLPEAVEEGRRFTMAEQRMKVALDSVRSVIATSLLPVVSYLTNKTADLVGWFSRMTRGSNLLNVALAAAGVAGVVAARAILAAWWPVIAPALASAAALGVILLVLDDIVTFLRGGNSVIGEFIDYLYGAGAARETLQYLPVLWQDITGWVNEAADAVMRFLGRIGIVRGEVAAIGRLRPVSERGIGAVPAPGGSLRPARPGAPAPRRITVTPAPATVDRTPTPNWLAALPAGGSAMFAPRAVGVGVVRPTTNTTTNHFTITGITNPQEAANRVAQILDERARRERDRDHPRDPED